MKIKYKLSNEKYNSVLSLMGWIWSVPGLHSNPSNLIEADILWQMEN